MMRIYLSEEDRWSGKPLYKALVEAMRANDIAGVTVYRGILGYGAHRRVHKDKPLHSSHQGSVMLSAIDTAEKLQAFLPLVDQMVEEGLVVFSERGHHQICLPPPRSWTRHGSRRGTRHGSRHETRRRRPAMKEQFPARMLRIHFGEDDRWQGKPLHEAIVANARNWALRK